MDYILSNLEINSTILDKKLLDLYCKHVISKNTNQNIYTNGIESNYPGTLWASKRRHDMTDKEVCMMENDIINKMIIDDFKRPARIIVDKNCNLWADNTHTIISHIKRGKKTLKEIPFYVVDLSSSNILVLDFKASVCNNKEDINGAIEHSLLINERIEKGWRNNNLLIWTIKDLCNELNMLM